MSIKLLYITNGIDGPGGLERVLSIKANYLAEKLNYDVHIVTLNQGSSSLFYDFSSLLNYHDISIKTKGVFWFLQYIFELKRTIKIIQPDIISVCDDGLKAFLLPLIFNKTYPLVYERHASKRITLNEENPNLLRKLKFKLSNAMMDFGAKYYDAFIVLTKTNLNEWNLKNAVVIPNPLSFNPKAKSTLLNKTLIAVGNHGFQKGYDRLLKIWKIVVKKHPEWQLEIYGKMDEGKKHINTAKELDILSNTKFFHPVKNIQEKYKQASIYVMTSRSEGFGMVLIEAMAFGVPCIAFDCPSGPKDIISNNLDGYLIENGNIQAFVEKLDVLITNEELRYNMGRCAIEKSNKYMPEIIVTKWHTLFLELTK